MKKSRRAAPFFGLDDEMPVVLALILGLQHSLSMLAGIITPPIIIASAGNFDASVTQYLVSTSLIVCGILSTIQITRFHIPMTQYYIGTGLLSVVGTSFTIIPAATGAFNQFYANGICQIADDGTKMPCYAGYGAILGTQCCTALMEILLSFLPAPVLKRIFPPIVTGPTVALIGVALIQSGFQDWAGGAACASRPDSGIFQLCPTIFAPKPLPWGSAQFIGLGFLVFLTIILLERFGAPIMKSCAVVLSLLVGCIVASATGYFDRSGVDAAPGASFIWVHTFPLTVYGPLVLPLLAVAIVLAMEAVGDITATADVSRLEVEGRVFDSRLQGGILADGLSGIFSALFTSTTLSVFAQNNGVIALTRCANRSAGYCACFFLLIMGIFSKFAASLVAIPNSVLGGVTTFLFSSVAVSGIRIISTIPFTRRNRFILTTALAPGVGAILVPNWFSFVFTYNGGGAKGGFLDAIVLVLETGFALTGFLAMLLNIVLEEEVEDEAKSITADQADIPDDREVCLTFKARQSTSQYTY